MDIWAVGLQCAETPNIGLPRKQKIAVNKCWVPESEIGEEMLTILDVNFGREFFGGPETLEKQGRKIRYQNSPSKFAEKFAGDFPKFEDAQRG